MYNSGKGRGPRMTVCLNTGEVSFAPLVEIVAALLLHCAFTIFPSVNLSNVGGCCKNILYSHQNSPIVLTFIGDFIMPSCLL